MLMLHVSAGSFNWELILSVAYITHYKSAQEKRTDKKLENIISENTYSIKLSETIKTPSEVVRFIYHKGRQVCRRLWT